MQNVKRIFPRRIIFKIRSFVRFSIRIRCFRYRFFFLCVCFYENFYKSISFSVPKTKGEFSLIEHDSKERLPANFVRSLKSQPPRIIITTEDSWPSSFYVRGLYYSAFSIRSLERTTCPRPSPRLHVHGVPSEMFSMFLLLHKNRVFQIVATQF